MVLSACIPRARAVILLAVGTVIASLDVPDELHSCEEVSLLQTDLSVDILAHSEHKHHIQTVRKDAASVRKPEATIAPPKDAQQATGVSANGAGDGSAFFTAVFTNIATIFVLIIIFMQLRTRWPSIYSNNVITGRAPTSALGSKPADVKAALEQRWGWWRASMNTSTAEVAETMGLDQAMLLEFSNLCMKILAWIGVPMLLVIGPINYAFGGHPANKLGDNLSSLSFGNIESGSKLYWMHGLVVWYVVIVVKINVYGAQKKFLDLRYTWLRNMSSMRARTLLIEGIPDDYRSDSKVKNFFEKIFGKGSVKSAYVAKESKLLDASVAAYESASRGLHEAKARWKLDGGLPDKRPRSMLYGDLIEYYTKKVATAEAEIKEERKRILASASDVGGVNMYAGFITFNERKYTQMALYQQYGADMDDWVMSIPPESTDVIWSDLFADPTRQKSSMLLGYAAIVGLYFAYTPCVVGISQLATSIDMGPLEPLWIAFAPTLGLQFMVAFLPTFIINIFNIFFTLKAEVWAQKRLQVYYFWFQVVFVVLVTAIGPSVADFTKTALTEPFKLPEVLGEAMPQATHFYMNFLVLQWTTHFMNLLRYVPLAKFKSASLLYDSEETARQLAEPEDQDYYGMGSRSARFTINMMIGIVYGTLSPPINLLAWINFFVCRLVYGYLMPFAETKKADLGGVFWVDKLRHLFTANIIYCVVMIGVLSGRANMTGFTPTFVAAPSLIYVIWSMIRFERAFAWEQLPLDHVVEQDEKIRERKNSAHGVESPYVQKTVFPSN